MTTDEVWQQLLSLENRDATTRWFEDFHARELNARRAKEINSSAKQAREYFRNASQSAYSVRPLLSFYGVACLSRALALLFKESGGEETLVQGHGLETCNWSSVLCGDIADALRALPQLRVRTRAGLFTSFLTQTRNQTSVHINSSAVGWRIDYDIPPDGLEISLGDLLSRLPDLEKDVVAAGEVVRVTDIHDLAFNPSSGFQGRVRSGSFGGLNAWFAAAGYNVSSDPQWTVLNCSTADFTARPLQFVHAYIHKTFGTIPTLYVSEPFAGGRYLSQLAQVHAVSYFLGMLVRYYPTHWVALIQGEKGDTWWPTLNRAQHMIENAYPEIAVELIRDMIEERKKERASQQTSP